MSFNYFDTQSDAINNLRYKIRYAKETYDPSLFSKWLQEESVLLNDSVDIVYENAHHRMYEGQFRLLLDAIKDNLLPKSWRSQCLEYIFRPLINLEYISFCEIEKQRVQNLWVQLKMTDRL